LKIFLAAWMELVTMIILEISSQFEAWFIPHLIVKSSASLLVTKTVWWRVLINGLLNVCICKMDVAMLFLILASIIMMAVDGELDDSITMLSSWRHILSFFSLLHRLKENWSEKLSIILRPGDNSEWRGKKKGKIPLNLLFVSTKWPLTWDL